MTLDQLMTSPAPATTQVWCYNVLTIDTVTGAGIRLLTVLDERSNRALLIHVSESMDEAEVVRELEHLARRVGVPAGACTYNAPPFVTSAVSTWLRRLGTGSSHMPPSTSYAHSFAGAYQRALRRAMLDAQVFDVEDARLVARRFQGEAHVSALEPRASASTEVPVVPLAPAPAQPASPVAVPTAPSPATAQAAHEQPAEPPQRQRAGLGRRIANLFVGLLVAFSCIAVLVLGFGPVTGRYRTSPVLSNSMKPTFAVGDMIVLVPMKASRVKKGDIIQYRAPKGDREIVTHRVLRVTNSGSSPTVVTKGDNNNYEDAWPMTFREPEIWKVRRHVPRVGWAIVAFKSTKGMIVLGAAIALLMLGNAISFYRDSRSTRSTR